ncbi:MAG: hypothetical protein MJ252_23115, partial [archaeon]|nr:hypothetical protein [archaeon]
MNNNVEPECPSEIKNKSEVKWTNAKKLLEDEVSLKSATEILRKEKIENHLKLSFETFEREILIHKFKYKNSRINIEKKEIN